MPNDQPTHHTFPVSAPDSGQTLAALVRERLGNLTWTQARRLIASRRVRIGGSVCLDDARRLKAGEIVEIISDSAAAPSKLDVRIVFVDSDLAVVEKPPGLQTVRRVEERNWSEQRKRRQPVLQEIVEQTLSAGPGSAGAIARVRAVHRLDRDTSGLMIFARSAGAEQELIRRFAHHDIQRAYHAVVHGAFCEPRTIETRLVRDRGDGIRGSVLEEKRGADAQHAVTHVRPMEQIGDAFMIVECRLETGRTHQIRIHLAEIGHRVCGERVYVRPTVGAEAVEDHSGAPRQALHSAELQFEHPVTKKSMTFESPWPKDLARWIEGIR